MNISTQLPEHINILIKGHNTARKINSFLYKEEDCNQLLKTFIKGKSNEELSFDRWEFVNMCNNIERELIPFIYDNYHGKKVTTSEGIEGVIEHLTKRTFENRELDNTVSFRWTNDACTEETIALWVNTGDKYTTHLYTVNNLTLTELVDAKNECELNSLENQSLEQ